MDRSRIGFHYHVNIGTVPWAITPEDFVEKAERVCDYGIIVVGGKPSPSAEDPFISFKAVQECLIGREKPRNMYLPLVEATDIRLERNGRQSDIVLIFPEVIPDFRVYPLVFDTIDHALEKGGIPVIPYGLGGWSESEIDYIMRRYQGATIYLEMLWWYHSWPFLMLGLVARRNWKEEVESLAKKFPSLAAADSYFGEGLEGEVYNEIVSDLGAPETPEDVIEILRRGEVRPLIREAPSFSEGWSRAYHLITDYLRGREARKLVRRLFEFVVQR